jgi:hypothetical protein
MEDLSIAQSQPNGFVFEKSPWSLSPGALKEFKNEKVFSSFKMNMKARIVQKKLIISQSLVY